MLNFNKAMISGRITRDPELKTTQTGLSVVTFTVAVNRRTRSGEQSAADFIDVVAWRNTAEFVCKYFKKGSAIFVVGQIQVRNWTDNNNVSRKTFEIIADEVHFAESKRDNAENGANEFISAPFEKKDDSAPVPDFQELIEDDDKLPF